MTIITQDTKLFKCSTIENYMKRNPIKMAKNISTNYLKKWKKIDNMKRFKNLKKY